MSNVQYKASIIFIFSWKKMLSCTYGLIYETRVLTFEKNKSAVWL